MAKLITVKMNPIGKQDGAPALLCGPTVMHFLALQAEQATPDVLAFASQWENVWLASEISFSQVCVSKARLTLLDLCVASVCLLVTMFPSSFITYVLICIHCRV